MAIRKPTVRQRLMDWAGLRVARALWAGRMRHIPARDTTPYARLMNIGSIRYQKDRPLIKPTPSNLRMFSRTPYARRAINRIKNAIVSMDWEVSPKDGVRLNSEINRQIQIVTACLERPNNDDSFRTLAEQVIEDYLVSGAGAIEQEIGAIEMRPLWLWPVDALSIEVYAGWSGGRDEARYLQTHGYGNVGGVSGIQLTNEQLIYIRRDPNTENPFGYGCLEVAFNSISRQLGVADYAGNVTSNGQPENLMQMVGMDRTTLDAFRDWWRNEIEGQGETPILGGDEVRVHKLRGATDDALYLKYQEFLLREIATAFELSPQNLGVEADVNRNTSETAEDRDWSSAIVPAASNFASYLTREAIHGRLGFSQIEFHWVGLDRKDEASTAEIFERYYRSNAITPNEQRGRLGLPKMDSEWGDLTFADMQIALAAAKGAKETVSQTEDDARAQRTRTPSRQSKRKPERPDE